MRQNKSASRAMDLLLLLARAEHALSLAEISMQLDIPKSSAFELVYTLVDKDFIEQDETTKGFSLGIKTFEVGNAYGSKMDILRIARPWLSELAKKAGETIFLAIENDGMIVYIDKFLGSAEVTSSCDIGARNHMYFTGLGKALLAAYDEEKALGLLHKHPMIKKTQTTITDVPTLLNEFKQARHRGYAIDNRENSDLLFCVAAPIYSSTSEPIAAISIVSIWTKIDNPRKEYLGNMVNACALEISKKLGYPKDKLF